jgi:hypothetical protein
MRAARTLAAVRLEAALRGLNVRTREQRRLQLARTARAAALLQARLSIPSLSALALALSLSLVCTLSLSLLLSSSLSLALSFSHL